MQHQQEVPVNAQLLRDMMDCVDTSNFPMEKKQSWMTLRTLVAGEDAALANELKRGASLENILHGHYGQPNIKEEVNVTNVAQPRFNAKDSAIKLKRLLSSGSFSTMEKKASVSALLGLLETQGNGTMGRNEANELLRNLGSEYAEDDLKQLSGQNIFRSFTHGPGQGQMDRKKSFDIIQGILTACSNSAIQKPMTSQDSFRFQNLEKCLETIETAVAKYEKDGQDDEETEEVVAVNDNLDNLLDDNISQPAANNYGARGQVPNQQQQSTASSNAFNSRAAAGQYGNGDAYMGSQSMQHQAQVMSSLPAHMASHLGQPYGGNGMPQMRREPHLTDPYPMQQTGLYNDMGYHRSLPPPLPQMMQGGNYMYYNNAPQPHHQQHQQPPSYTQQMYQAQSQHHHHHQQSLGAPSNFAYVAGNGFGQNPRPDQYDTKVAPPSTTASDSSSYAKFCMSPGCNNIARTKGMCKVHGGGRRCKVDGCMKSAQTGHLCIAHGGGKPCRMEGCPKTAQSRGLCKQHGGGVRCKFEGCTKSCQSGGYCRGHGGGKRCEYAQCKKWAQRNGFCAKHAQEMTTSTPV
ncbi:unnamed protein product [Aphanomyces euteiches]|uniref:WRKY19-like zinc finger domain-containing protein n=1 Tax=Aphanomyces euteiches TaxID=100861 RepID=A0A6G0X1Y1_9STRA|nr:hypothetical protein Ae201684_009464 [Aphanomyces euteiches]KAH9069994.1 hypothetical protein Ae201684P_002367 [Aphanomyces euteiches]KAH9136225.1 hypothetical protein AeRB84_018556 [Aphanomyces euteiches]